MCIESIPKINFTGTSTSTHSLSLSLKYIAERIKIYMRRRPTIRLFILFVWVCAWVDLRWITVTFFKCHNLTLIGSFASDILSTRFLTCSLNHSSNKARVRLPLKSVEACIRVFQSDGQKKCNDDYLQKVQETTQQRLVRTWIGRFTVFALLIQCSAFLLLLTIVTPSTGNTPVPTPRCSTAHNYLTDKNTLTTAALRLLLPPLRAHANIPNDLKCE